LNSTTLANPRHSVAPACDTPAAATAHRTPAPKSIELGHIEPYEVHRALATMLGSACFTRSQRMSRLLRYLVERTLDGQVRELNEYAIGIGVFDRDPSTYNPGEDPIVRVQIGRLRDKLQHYYTHEPLTPAVRFTIPLGNYMPQITRAEAAPTQATRRPTVRVSAIRCITKHAEGCADSCHFAEGLGEELVHQLFQTLGGRVISHLAPEAASTSTLQPTHTLEASVRMEERLIRANVRLIDHDTGTLTWSEQYDRTLYSPIALEEELALSICEALKTHLAVPTPVTSAA